MTSEQAISFFAGLNNIEHSCRFKLGQFTQISRFLIVLREPITNSTTLKPIGGIEKQVELWREVQSLFNHIVA